MSNVLFSAIPTLALCTQLTPLQQRLFISSTQAASAPCTKATGLYDQEFTIRAQQGQQVVFTLINIAALFNRPHYGSQHDLGYILSGQSERVNPIKQTDQLESEIVVSTHHQASVFLSSSPTTQFLIAFKGINHIMHTLQIN